MKILDMMGHWGGRRLVRETWHIDPDERRARVYGRETYASWLWNFNIFWWFMNDGEPTAPPWYRPDWWKDSYPQWALNILWYIRNPLQNFGKYVMGVTDKNYVIIGSAPILASTMEDVGGYGFKWHVILLYGWIPLPFASFNGPNWMWYAGWQWWGFFGFKLNRQGTGKRIV